MVDLTEISIALLNGTATFFLGTGFSKYLTNGSAPSWCELFFESAIRIDPSRKLANDLFYIDAESNSTSPKLDILICAQIIETEYIKNKKNLREEIKNIIEDKINPSTINQDNLLKIKNFFNSYPIVSIVTTNYDDLLEKYIFENNCTSFVEGKIIPCYKTRVNIYHIHGEISNPSSLVLTLEDYYSFQRRQSYLSRKFYTLLQENTTCITGYSLGDFNLNFILNEVKQTKQNSFRKSHLLYITRSLLSETIKRFYNYTYAIDVIDSYSIDSFFSSLISKKDKADELIKSVSVLQDVINGSQEFTNEYLKLHNSFVDILNQAAVLSIDIHNEGFLKVISSILNTKKDFTSETGAWIQYEYFASWLIELATRIDIKGSKIENEYINWFHYSLSTSSKKSYLGFSWNAYKQWYNRWPELKFNNQIFLKDYIQSNSWGSVQEIEYIFTKTQ